MNKANLEILGNIFAGVESGDQIYANKKYGAYDAPYFNSTNEHTITLGWFQCYGYNAMKLMNRIFEMDKNEFRSLDTVGIENMLGRDWVIEKWCPDYAEKQVIVSIIMSNSGKKAQDEFYEETVSRYITHAEEFGITDVKLQMMWAEIEHLGGVVPVSRIFERAEKPYSLKSIYESLQLDKEDMSSAYQVGDKLYDSRHRFCMLWIEQYALEEEDAMGNSEFELVYEVEKNEEGYLEKASAAYLDDKTKNAGYSNFTKYWRDLTKAGLMKVYGYGPDSGFAGGVDWPYCAAGQAWSFIRALGEKRAQELLLHEGAAFINCETMYQKAKKANRLISYPKAGCLVLFKKSNGIHHHVEMCYAVKDGIMYTMGFNTSGASTVIANGGGVCDKRYQIGNFLADYFMPDFKSGNDTVTVDPGTSVTLLKLGSNGEAVADMQYKLIFLGYDLGKYGADGDFGSNTKDGLIQFQTDHGIEADGIYGEISARELNVAYESAKNSSVDPDKATILFTGRVLYDNTDVRTWAGREYGNIKSWPKLNKGNLVVVLNYTQKDTQGADWYFVHITDGKNYSYKGFVPAKNIERV